MDLEELRAFLQVVRQGSFLGAADALTVSRSTLRRRVESLEARAGVPLLESTQQGVVLTDAGKVLATRGRALEEEASALLASVREVGHEPSGVLRVSIPVGLPPHGMAPLFAAIRAEHPRLSFELRHSDDPLSESLAEVDVAVHFGPPPARGRWISSDLIRMREWLLASPDYLQRRGAPRRVEDLAGHELIAWRPPGADPRDWPSRLGGTFRVEPALISSDVHFLRTCCLAGAGIALLPDAQLPDLGVPQGALVPVLPDLVGGERSLRVSVPEALAHVPKIKMVLDRVRDFLGPPGEPG